MMSSKCYVWTVFIAISVHSQDYSQDLWDIVRDEEGKCNSSSPAFGCYCDSSCARYGDCCRDSQYFVEAEQKLGASRYSCSRLDRTSHFGVLVISSCDPVWNLTGIRTLCEQHNLNYSDPLFEVPVTSNRTNHIYRNSYCAACNYDLDLSKDRVWSIKFECSNPKLSMLNSSNLLQRLKYDPKEGSWVLNLTGVETNHSLSTSTQSPTVKSFFSDYGEVHPYYDYDNDGADAVSRCEAIPVGSGNARYCEPDVIYQCDEDWNGTDAQMKCESYTAHMCYYEHKYRNYHCIMCNNLSPAYTDRCIGVMKTRSFSPTTSRFSVLLDWHIEKQENPCNDNEIFDLLSKTCRSIRKADKVIALNTSRQIDYCDKMVFTEKEYTMKEDNETVYIAVRNKTYQPDEYNISENSVLYVCMDDVLQSEKEEKEPMLQYITIVGLSLSIAFLVLHLLIFATSPKMRNLSSMNLASLCIALLLLYTTFITSGFLTPSTTPCIVMAVFLHYNLLASFSWMLTISFDIWRALREATTRFRTMSGMHGLRFALYSAWSWFIPGIVIGITFSTGVSPDYGVWRCWIGNPDALLIFVVAPLAVVMFCNIVFFAWSAYLIYSTSSDPSGRRTDFRLYGRLAFIMGLTWTTGLVAGQVNVTGLWYVFAVLNTFQGVFIFFAFSCTKKMKRQLRILAPWRFTQKGSQQGLTGTTSASSNAAQRSEDAC